MFTELNISPVKRAAAQEIEDMIMLFAAANGGRSPWRTYPGRWIKLTLVQIREQDRSDDKTVLIIKRNYVA